MSHTHIPPLTRLSKYALTAAASLLLGLSLTTMSTNSALAGAPTPPLNPTVSEAILPSALEFTLNNPNPSTVGRAFGMALGIEDQQLTADTTNGWDYATLFFSSEWTQLMQSGTSATVFDLTWQEFFGGLTFSQVFPDFQAESDVVLGFFVDYTATAGQNTSPANIPNFGLDDDLLVDPAASLAGFFGLSDFAPEFATLGAVVGTGGTALISTSIPEPETLALLGLGLAGLGLARRRWKMKT